MKKKIPWHYHDRARDIYYDGIKEIDLEYLLEVNQKRKICNDYTSLWQYHRKACDLSWRKCRNGYDSVFKR